MCQSEHITSCRERPVDWTPAQSSSGSGFSPPHPPHPSAAEPGSSHLRGLGIWEPQENVKEASGFVISLQGKHASCKRPLIFSSQESPLARPGGGQHTATREGFLTLLPAIPQ